jgi:anti-anti-sigma factor
MVVNTLEGTVFLSGALDVRSVAVVREALHSATLASAGNLIVDVTDVELIDAAGLGVLAAAHRRIESQGRHLVLRGCSPSMRRILSVTGLTRVLHVERRPPCTLTRAAQAALSAPN